MIWIIGAKGMLGHDVSLTLEKSGLTCYGSDKEVDILSPSALAAKAEEISPDWIVNCSAYTAVDRAEDETELAYKLNRDGVGNIARLANKLDIPVIHISTDYVFDGTSETPLAEDAPTGPISVYGKSKLAGDKVLMDTCEKVFIIRTAWLYGQFGSNFVYTMIKLMNKLDTLKVVADQKGSPTWSRDLAGLIATIIQADSTEYGIFHYSGEEDCSWYDFAREIYREGKETGLISGNCLINPCSSSEFPTKATRPAYSLLSKDKVKTVFSISVPKWQDSIKIFMKGINNNDII
ncbi:MAG: dTDP-4-dehydrorhamnose reductase [Spirochaetaceae bacterium]|nr:dTDP-4-dehydrorhamnose reductase [Spirochaetaceae bacterium]